MYGRDRNVSNTDLRHIRTGYALDGKSWKCYTKGDCCRMTQASTQCKWGAAHGNNGMTFSVPGPVQYFMVGTWGRTEIWEIQFLACLTKPLPKPPNRIIDGRLTEGLNMPSLPKRWAFTNGPKGKANSVRILFLLGTRVYLCVCLGLADLFFECDCLRTENIRQRFEDSYWRRQEQPARRAYGCQACRGV